MDDYTESDMWVSCGKSATIHIYGMSARVEVLSIQKMMKFLSESDFDAELLKDRLSSLSDQTGRLMRKIEEYEADECPFEGEVTVFWTGTTGKWTCPYCDHEHEAEGGEDPDDAYERWKDSRYE